MKSHGRKVQPLSRSERETAFAAASKRAFDQLEDWYDQHPEASLGEIEQETRRVRRALMGEGLQLIINGRDTGYRKTQPLCAQCQQPMKFESYRPWGVATLEGDVQLQRAYYRCTHCKAGGFSPLGPETEITGRSLE